MKWADREERRVSPAWDHRCILVLSCCISLGKWLMVIEVNNLTGWGVNLPGEKKHLFIWAYCYWIMSVLFISVLLCWRESRHCSYHVTVSVVCRLKQTAWNRFRAKDNFLKGFISISDALSEVFQVKLTIKDYYHRTWHMFLCASELSSSRYPPTCQK